MSGLWATGMHVSGRGEAMKRCGMTTAVAALVAAWSLLAGQGAARGDADESLPPEIVGVRVGFAGHYKPGLWTPVEVRVRGGGAAMNCRIALTAPDGDGVPCRVLTPADEPCQIEPGREASFVSYVRFGRTEGSLSVELREGDRAVAERTFEAGAAGPQSEFPKAAAVERAVVRRRGV